VIASLATINLRAENNGKWAQAFVPAIIAVRGDKLMRDLTPLELEAVAGGLRELPKERITLRTLIVAFIRRILDPRGGTKKIAA
jgi:hypothetical protein